MQAEADKLIKYFDGPGYPIFQHLQRVAQAYINLTNAATAVDAEVALKELRAASGDCEALIRKALIEHNCPEALVLNVNAFAEKNWQLDALSGLYANAMHYLARFMHSPTNAGRVKELTSLYYLVRDLAECAKCVKAESYRSKLQ